VSVNVTFSAPSQTKELMNVPFEVSSGPVNVGCDEARHVEIPFHIPVQNATLGDIHTQWVNTGNLVSTTAHFEQRSPTDLVAVGDIRGIARNFIFNCPGGGHGTLAMQGAYSYQKETRGPEAVVSTVHESVPIGSRFTVAIPPIPVDESLKSDVVVVSKDGTSHLVGTISSSHPDIFDVRQQSGTIDLKPSIEHGFLILQFLNAGAVPLLARLCAQYSHKAEAIAPVATTRLSRAFATSMKKKFVQSCAPSSMPTNVQYVFAFFTGEHNTTSVPY
jgi:hypothetical protein